MPWQIVLSLDQAPTFYHLHFQCHETSLSVPLTWSFFASIISYGISFLLQASSSFMSGKFSFTSLLCCTSRVSGEWRRQHSQGLWSFSCIQRKFQRYHYLYFHLLASPLFWLFVQCHVGLFITRRPGGNTIACFAGYQWPEKQMHGDQLPADLERSDEMTCICYLCSDLWTEELGSEVCTLYSYSANIPWRLTFEKCWGTRTLFN